MRDLLFGFVAASILGIGLADTPPPAKEPAGGQQPALNLQHVTSFVVFPQDCNSNYPMLFGGKTLAEMDRCAAVTVRRLLYASNGAEDAVTVGITNVKFHKPAKVKDLLFVTGKVIKTGATSITVAVTVEKESGSARELIAEGEFTFVAYSFGTLKAVPHGIEVGK